MPAPVPVALSPGALADIDRLDRFLRPKNPAAANRMLAAFDAAFGRLATNPRLGRRVGEADAMRALVVRFGRGGYFVLYEVQEALVVVVRVYHGKEER